MLAPFPLIFLKTATDRGPGTVHKVLWFVRGTIRTVEVLVKKGQNLSSSV